jgi:hypothetical protein
MSQEDLGVVQSPYDAWKRGECPGRVELMDSEIEDVNPDLGPTIDAAPNADRAGSMPLAFD